MKRRGLIALLLLLVVVPAPAVAAPRDVAITAVKQWLLPAYDRLGVATAAQRAAWEQFCGDRKPAAIEALRGKFHAVADGWAAIEFITLGPMTLSLRTERFNMFPDRRNAVARALADLVRSDDAERLSPERFGRIGAAGQGLPALERLLFEDAFVAQLTGADARACGVGLAIARNLDDIVHEVRAEWGDRQSGVLGKLVRGEGDIVFFPKADAALSILLTDLAGLFQRIVDARMLPVMGANADEAKPLLAEGRRSARSSRNIRMAIAGGAALAAVLANGVEPAAREAVAKSFAAAGEAAAQLPDDLGAAAQNPAARGPLEGAVTAFKATQRAVAGPLARALGVSLGFNSLDGD